MGASSQAEASDRAELSYGKGLQTQEWTAERSAKHDNRQPRRKQAVKSIVMLHDMHEFADSFIVAADD